MVAAAARPAVRSERELRCNVCGRFIGGVTALADVATPRGLFRVRLYCLRCRSWRFFDPATGAAVTPDAPDPARARLTAAI